MKIHAAIFVLIAVSAAWPMNGSAQPASEGGDSATVAALERTLVDAIARAERSVVAVARSEPPRASLLVPQIQDVFGDLRQQSAADEQYTTAAGVLIDGRGLVLTEYLAVREGDQHTVTTVDGKTYPATIKAADPRSSLAVLEITATASPRRRAGEPDDSGDRPSVFPAIRFGAVQPRKGQFVIAIGNPYAIRSDGEPTASWGTVTNLARKAPAGENLNDTPGPAADYRTTIHHLGTLIQTDAKLGWSAGGGALVNLRGELVGLTTSIATIAGHEQPAGYAIAIDDAVRRIIDTLKQGREVEYGLLGVSFRPLLNTAAERTGQTGVVVQQVYPGSPAAQAGLEAGDVVTHVAGNRVDHVDRIQLAVSMVPPAQPLTIGYRRDDRGAELTATLAKLAVPGQKIVTNRPPSWRGLRVDYATALDTPTLTMRITTGALDPAGCVIVTEVEPDGAAWRAGVRPGMFISHVGPRRVTTPDEFREAVKGADGMVSIRLTEPVAEAGERRRAEVRIPSVE